MENSESEQRPGARGRGRGRAQSTRLYAFRLGVVGLRAAETEETFVLLGVAGGRYCNDRPGL